VKKSVVSVIKPIGWTPFRTVLEFKKANHAYMYDTISYAGRLDPMAEGVLLLLIGEENKNRKLYEGLKKEYIAEIIFGITTDTYDVMGIIDSDSLKSPNKKKVEAEVASLVGKNLHKYPPYSSKTVGGRPLYWWAREGKLSEIKLPEKKIEIFSSQLMEIKNIKVEEVGEMAIEMIEKANGDFRQEKIIKLWKELLVKGKNKKVMMIKVKIDCSSGTYVRRIASDLGEKLLCGALCTSIKRVRVGEYEIDDSMMIF